jgi:4-hydroxy-tetrahydrodipicolinate reductase
MPISIAIVGHGRMGREVAQLARERGHEIHAVIGSGEPLGAAAGADVAVEFTTPGAVVGNLLALARLEVPVVTGTTGWHERLDEVRAGIEGAEALLLHASNFSIGAQVFFRAAADLARRVAGQPGFDGFIVETHHAAKLDAPSGTALRLQRGVHGADAARHVPITSVRAGHVPGTHELVYDAVHETVRLEHSARSRTVFAAGALAAAEWLAAEHARGRRGVLTFEEMLFGAEDR